jgi:Predicted membrane protein
MIVRKTLGLKEIYEFGGHHFTWLITWMLIVCTLYYFTRWEWMTIPWLPLSVIGTAVAFYVGFKNNQAYGRLWEARKIWGSIINNSRSFGAMLKHFVTNDTMGEEALKQAKIKMIHRHIAWLYTLRAQLLMPTPWEHVSLRWRFGSFNRRRHHQLLDIPYKQELAEIAERPYLDTEEQQSYEGVANKATQLIDRQTADLARLHRKGCMNMMQHIELQRMLNGFYDEQGKAERIKRFPFPRHYGSFSFVFVCIFVFLLPFGIVGEFSKLGEGVYWLSVPFGALIGWIFVIMEIVGDYAENPFEGLYNDVPMLSICRTIEIDLLQMLGEKNVPKPIQPRNNILM